MRSARTRVQCNSKQINKTSINTSIKDIDGTILLCSTNVYTGRTMGELKAHAREKKGEGRERFVDKFSSSPSLDTVWPIGLHYIDGFLLNRATP